MDAGLGRHSRHLRGMLPDYEAQGPGGGIGFEGFNAFARDGNPEGIVRKKRARRNKIHAAHISAGRKGDTQMP